MSISVDNTPKNSYNPPKIAYKYFSALRPLALLHCL